MIGLGNIGSQIRSDLRRLTGGNFLNTSSILMEWQEALSHRDFQVSSAVEEWTFEHRFGRWPMVTALAASGAVLSPEEITFDRQSAAIKFSAAQSGSVLFLRPHLLHEQLIPAAEWIVPHGLGAFPLVQVIGSAAELVSEIVWQDAATVKVAFPSPVAGRLLLAKHTAEFEQAAPAAEWLFSYEGSVRPLVQFVDDEGRELRGQVEYESPNAIRLTLEEPASGHMLLAASGNSELEIDPNLETSEPETETARGTWRALTHFVQPLKSGSRKFTELQVGDVMLDFPDDVPLAGKSGAVLWVDGRPYVQKEVGRELMEYYDLVIGGQRVFRTVVVTPKG